MYFSFNLQVYLKSNMSYLYYKIFLSFYLADYK